MVAARPHAYCSIHCVTRNTFTTNSGLNLKYVSRIASRPQAGFVLSSYLVTFEGLVEQYTLM